MSMEQNLDSGIPDSLRQFLATTPQGAIAKISYTHDAMIDEIIRNPHASQGALGAMFGYTQGWVCQVIASDAFQSRLAERKNEIIDPALKATVEERLKGLVIQSIEKLKAKLESPIASDDLALGVLNSAAKALGYGAKQAPVINQNFVVQIPEKIASSAEWAAGRGPNSADGRLAAPPLPGISRTVESNSADAAIETGRPGSLQNAVAPTQKMADAVLDAFINA